MAQFWIICGCWPVLPGFAYSHMHQDYVECRRWYGVEMALNRRRKTKYVDSTFTCRCRFNLHIWCLQRHNNVDGQRRINVVSTYVCVHRDGAVL